jgi:hypothetical protein
MTLQLRALTARLLLKSVFFVVAVLESCKKDPAVTTLAPSA